MKSLLLFLATAALVRAVTFSGTTTVSPGYSVTEPVTVSLTGTLTLSAPGTYTATNWTVSGDVRLSAPGEYTIVSTGGGFTVGLTGTVRGPSSGNATLRVVAQSAPSVSGTIAANVTLAVGAVSEPVTTPTPPLVNMSVRATLAAGQILNPGFVIGGTVPRRVLIRAIGPTLTAFGVTSPLTTPTLAVFNGNAQIAANAGWGGGATLSAVFSAVGAFALPVASRDAALVLTLAPGNYTAQIGGGAGEVLAEVYFID